MHLLDYINKNSKYLDEISNFVGITYPPWSHQCPES
jgi:hypothetical protein